MFWYIEQTSGTPTAWTFTLKYRKHNRFYTPITTILKCCCRYELNCSHMRIQSACCLYDASLTPRFGVLRLSSSIWIEFSIAELLHFTGITLEYMRYIPIGRCCLKPIKTNLWSNSWAIPRTTYITTFGRLRLKCKTRCIDSDFGRDSPFVSQSAKKKYGIESRNSNHLNFEQWKKANLIHAINWT